MTALLVSCLLAFATMCSSGGEKLKCPTNNPGCCDIVAAGTGCPDGDAGARKVGCVKELNMSSTFGGKVTCTCSANESADGGFIFVCPN